MKNYGNTARARLASFYGPMNRTTHPRRPSTFLKPYDARINRHTGKPHTHAREIARHARQATS